jgi:uncharacterized membrane protein (UPF0127 family)
MTKRSYDYLLVFLFLLAAAVVAWMFWPAPAPVPMRQIHVEVEGSGFIVEVADTPQRQAHGLMSRPALAAGHGMLFVYPDSAPRSFWMKNTLIPLDILFFAPTEDPHAFRLDSWRPAVPCKADPCPKYPSLGSASVVLELPAGSVSRGGWKPGALLVVENDQAP